MDIQTALSQRRPLVIGAAGVAPLGLCAGLAALRDTVPNATAALGLVVLVVAAAATGIRAAGIVAAISSALWFDVLLTEPVGRLAITDPADIEATILLIAVGVAVTELALWGRRQQAKASRITGYLAGLTDTAIAAASSAQSPPELLEAVGAQLVAILGIDRCRFVTYAAQDPHSPRLAPNGRVLRAGRTVDVTRDGLPVDTETALPVQAAGTVVGQFLLTASSRVARPRPEQLRVAALLADQVGSALAREAGKGSTTPQTKAP